ncbi:MAG: 3'-5' exonuclease [Clostridia bacterium]|nr:3'-5' exonuclease [Clostridia bacterium]
METLQKLKDLGFREDRIKLDNVVYSENDDECVINLIFSEKQPLNDEEREKIREGFAQDLGDLCKTTVKFNKSCFDEDVVRKRVDEYFEQYYKALTMIFEKSDIEISPTEQGATIVFNCDPMTKQVLDNKDFVNDLRLFLSHKFFIDFQIKLVAKENVVDISDLATSEVLEDTLSACLAEEEKINKYLVEVGECFYGKFAGGEPVFISSAPKENGTAILLAGTVNNPAFSTFLRKSKMAGAEPEERKRFTFTLTDISGKTDVVIFPSDKTIEELEKIAEGDVVAVGGSVSVFNNRVNIKANSLSRCEIQTTELKKVYRKVNSKYYYVNPQPVSEVAQMDLFSMTDKKSSYWDEHESVVVFDFETTGLDAKSCQIIEIGAVKIRNGSIIETFQTLINPGQPIPAEITNLTHIDDSMVVDAPTIEQVLPDFYRFTHGSVLSAYNIDFDYQFLDLGGKKLRLLFNNEQIDTLKLARNKVPSLSNYKLGTVVKALNITLDNAHRALADAYATAKVFIKLI